SCIGLIFGAGIEFYHQLVHYTFRSEAFFEMQDSEFIYFRIFVDYFQGERTELLALTEWRKE
ncbi:MAG: hypothetical protein LBF17_00240, partial [Mediterranea sp.]|nr:hypothetical protein [Mediterranea sp.]